MIALPARATVRFLQLADAIAGLGYDYHSKILLRHAQENKPSVTKSVKDIPAVVPERAASAIIISAGPSVHKRKTIERIKASGYKGIIIAADGAYIACLRQGLYPDYLVTMDPHPARVVRWFGDPDIVNNSENDDYYERQDLDVEFRQNRLEQNERNIRLVNEHACRTKAVVCVSAHPGTVVRRLNEAGFHMYWWNPLCDNPDAPDSLTRKLYNINNLPCLNTGGTVGTAAWVFASDVLKIKTIAVTGMDYGYYQDTPIEKTQTYHELVAKVGREVNLSSYFMEYEFPLTGEKFYTDTTYYWYRKNFLELLTQSRSVTINCTEGGTLVDDRIKNFFLDQFLKDSWQKS